MRNNNEKKFHVHISLTEKKYFNLRTQNAKYTHKVPRIARKQTTTLSIPKVLVIAKYVFHI